MVLWNLLMMAVLANAEQQILEQVNRHRMAEGLGSLVWSEAAAAEARAHCGRVLEGKTSGPHDGFAARAERLRRTAGARRAGENVFLMENGRFRAERAIEAWLSSEGHRRTLEGPFDLTGVGVVIRGSRACAAQIFLGR